MTSTLIMQRRYPIWVYGSMYKRSGVSKPFKIRKDPSAIVLVTGKVRAFATCCAKPRKNP